LLRLIIHDYKIHCPQHRCSLVEIRAPGPEFVAQPRLAGSACGWFARLQQRTMIATSMGRLVTAKRQARLGLHGRRFVIAADAAPGVSQRVQQTDAPCIVKTKQLMARRSDVMSLAQGIVHCELQGGGGGLLPGTPAQPAPDAHPARPACTPAGRPPPKALEVASHLLANDPSIHGYGPADGLPPLRDALLRKLQAVNGLSGVSAHSPSLRFPCRRRGHRRGAAAACTTAAGLWRCQQD
jgi:hypothetical protein